MYALYCNLHPTPVPGTLDTETVANGWTLVSTHSRRHHLFTLLGKLAAYETTRWRRYRVFAHRGKQTIVGRLIAYGDMQNGTYTMVTVHDSARKGDSSCPIPG